MKNNVSILQASKDYSDTRNLRVMGGFKKENKTPISERIISFWKLLLTENYRQELAIFEDDGSYFVLFNLHNAK